MFFALAVPFFDYKRVSGIYLKILFAVCCCFSLFALFELLSKASVFTIRMPKTPGDVFVALNFAHNATGSLYAMVTLFALIFFLKERIIKHKIIYLVVFIICAAGLFFSKSRGSYTGFAAGMVFVLWMHFRSIKKFLIAAGVLITGLIPIVYLTGTWSRIIKIFDFNEVNVAARFSFWEKAWYLFTKSPVFGIGYGRQNDVSYLLYDKLRGIHGVFAFFVKPLYFFNDSQAHNSYIQFLAETGVFGLGLLLFFWVLCFLLLLRAYNKNNSSEYGKKIYLCGIGSIVILFVLSFTENYMSATTVMACISIVNSLAIGLAWQENKQQKNSMSQNQTPLT
jgi:O-antigen ligase